MPLMPIPPMPVKCRCWGLKNISLSYCFGFLRRCQWKSALAAAPPECRPRGGRAGPRQSARAAAPMRSETARARRPVSRTSANSRSPVISRSAHQPRRAGALAYASALRNWCWSAAKGNGTRMDGLPAAASSATAPAPERHTIRSAWAKAAGMSSMNGAHLALQPARREFGGQCLGGGAPGLVHDADGQPRFAEQRPALPRGLVQRARALAAAGDQHGRAPSPRGLGGNRKNSSRTGSPVTSVRPGGKQRAVSGKADQRPLTKRRDPPVGEPGDGVRLHHHHGDAPQPAPPAPAVRRHSRPC